ncbi:hypothetical protein BKA69DRAFT_1066679 [Paraphysoderma sedebokerense]|nr:hypothetical protein BKA69DRAFT_1066622 [Paraphysoderma sedebokerense]KAI9142500.1 hypothetical protein BKA69DRAFT_1066679 [Paraphysoderma sedebokerense]
MPKVAIQKAQTDLNALVDVNETTPFVNTTFTAQALCSADSRIPAMDLRSARLMPVGCTVWLFNNDRAKSYSANKCALSAGHCFRRPEQYAGELPFVLQFNPPDSLTPVIRAQHPHPDFQFAMDVSSLQHRFDPVSDWAYLGFFPNPNTGLPASAAANYSAHIIGDKTEIDGLVVNNDTLHMIGYGIDWDTPNRFLTSQISVGNFMGTGWFNETSDIINNTVVASPVPHGGRPIIMHRADSMSGNSGSAIINRRTGHAIG